MVKRPCPRWIEDELPVEVWWDRLDAGLFVTREEADELVRYIGHQWLDPNKYPALSKMLDRMGDR